MGRKGAGIRHEIGSGDARDLMATIRDHWPSGSDCRRKSRVNYDAQEAGEAIWRGAIPLDLIAV